MGPTEALDQVSGILVRFDIEFDIDDDRRLLRIHYPHGLINVGAQSFSEKTIVEIYADLAIDIARSPEVDAGVYVWANERNLASRFVRFSASQRSKGGGEGSETIWMTASWELLAEDLQASEFLVALDLIADATRRWSDELVQLFGGENYRIFVERGEDPSVEIEEDG